MEFNKESFKKAIKDCKIIRWENHFENVVKAYLKAETERANTANKLKHLVCDVCGSEDVIEAPHMGRNCNTCHPL